MLGTDNDNAVQPGDLLIYPEYSLIPPVFSKNSDLTPFAQELDGLYTVGGGGGQSVMLCGCADAEERAPVLARISCVAPDVDVYLIVNFIESARNSDGNVVFHNSNAVFDPAGNLIMVTRKVHLFGSVEPILFTKGLPLAGEDDVVFIMEVEGSDAVIPVSSVVCFDVLFNNTMGARAALLEESAVDRRTAQLNGVATRVPAILAAPVEWINTPPMMWAPLMHNAVSGVYDTVLAVSNIGFNSMTSGSGIYTRGTPAAARWSVDHKPDAFVLRVSLADIIGTPTGQTGKGRSSDPQWMARTHGLEHGTVHGSLPSRLVNVTTATYEINPGKGHYNGTTVLNGNLPGNKGMTCTLQWELDPEEGGDPFHVIMILGGGWDDEIYIGGPMATCWAVACATANCSDFISPDLPPITRHFNKVGLSLSSPASLYSTFTTLPWYNSDNTDIMPFFEMNYDVSRQPDYFVSAFVEDQPSFLSFGLFGTAAVDERPTQQE